ncbi:MAG: nuclear transport factor 2 family protein [Bacteroidetes bacterium]|nr:nuclear transport factor 2 family protein [Bacteroidota bacterium]
MKKIKTLLIYLFCLTAIILLPNTVDAQEWTQEQKEVLKLEQKMISAWENRDLEGYMDCLHENFVGWFNKDPHPMNKKTLKKWEKNWLSSSKIIVNHHTPLTVNVFDDTAISNSFEMTLREDDKGQKLTYAKWTVVFKKQNGKWLIIGMVGGKILED